MVRVNATKTLSSSRWRLNRDRDWETIWLLEDKTLVRPGIIHAAQSSFQARSH
ncbi:MAG TPA: hypothetical protein VF503_27920 [Sphingobium sp.]|uniref:hypothetical protein n=1 Tax=Sphingobium sp. TaxID=1912891 RepID=UPI002ED06BBC